MTALVKSDGRVTEGALVKTAPNGDGKCDGDGCSNTFEIKRRASIAFPELKPLIVLPAGWSYFEPKVWSEGAKGTLLCPTCISSLNFYG